MTTSPSSPTLPCENIADLPANAPSSDPQINESAMTLRQASAEAMFALTSYRAECWATMFILAEPARMQPIFYEIATLTAEKPNLMRYDSWQRTANAEVPWPELTETPQFTIVYDGASFRQQFGKVWRESTHTEPYYLYTIWNPGRVSMAGCHRRMPWRIFIGPTLSSGIVGGSS